MDISLNIEKLAHVGPRNKSRLNRLGIKTVRDLLWHFPSRYEDFTETLPIGQVEAGQKVNIQGQILKISSRRIFPRHLTITTAMVGDESGAIRCVWFNQPYLENNLAEGTFVSLAGKARIGKIGLHLSSPIYEKAGGSELQHTSGLVPIYPETDGVTSKYLRFLIKPLLENLKISDPLPQNMLSKYQFPDLESALQTMHYPADATQTETAKKRLAFQDLLLLQLKSLLERRKMNQLKSVPIKFNQVLVKEFVASLPFELTKDQRIAAWEILKDIEKSYPMNRLMEGDVGSGKTVVALIAAFQAAHQGQQSVFLAPTEVLAQQHYQTISSLLGIGQSGVFSTEPDISVALLTGSLARLNNSEIKKPELKKKIAAGDVAIIIGTHAVIQKGLEFQKLALVVIDEQHRFGVDQRSVLFKNDTVPHLLSMTATPIPRTLALSIYGDLDISIIKQKPKNRQKIITRVIGPGETATAHEFIRQEVKNGRQIFVICPRIEAATQAKATLASTKTRQTKMDSLWAEVKAVEEEYVKLSKEVFPDLRVAMLHGKLKPKDKVQIMTDFKKHKYDILVATSVIEVGVDIPNASVMMIESAERFGLAQLHQFRGRVGRDQYQSYCLLFTSSGQANQRLKALVDCDDGFELAEKDMLIRGPGEFFGTKQSGIADLAMAALADVELIKKARTEARTLLKEDSSLSNYPLLKEEVARLRDLTHFE